MARRSAAAVAGSHSANASAATSARDSPAARDSVSVCLVYVV